MRAWRVHSLGDPVDVMTLDEVPEPEPGPGQLKVKVRAAALNFPDILMAQGTYQEKPPLPFTPGLELCGELPDGRRVLGSPSGGPARSPSTRWWTRRSPGRCPTACPTSRPPRSTSPTRPVRRPAPSRRPAAGGVAAGARRRRRRRDGGHPAGQGRRRPGHRHRGRAGQDPGLPRPRRRPRRRLLQRGLRRPGQGDHRRPRCGRRLRPGRRRRVRRVDQVHRLRGPHRRRRVHLRPDPRRQGQPPAGQELLGAGLHWGLYRSKDPGRIADVHDALCALFAEGKIDPVIGQTLPLDQAQTALVALGDRGTVGKVVLVP